MKHIMKLEYDSKDKLLILIQMEEMEGDQVVADQAVVVLVVELLIQTKNLSI